MSAAQYHQQPNQPSSAINHHQHPICYCGQCVSGFATTNALLPQPPHNQHQPQPLISGGGGLTSNCHLQQPATLILSRYTEINLYDSSSQTPSSLPLSSSLLRGNNGSLSGQPQPQQHLYQQIQPQANHVGSIHLAGGQVNNHLQQAPLSSSLLHLPNHQQPLHNLIHPQQPPIENLRNGGKEIMVRERLS